MMLLIYYRNLKIPSICRNIYCFNNNYKYDFMSNNKISFSFLNLYKFL